jgi:hypothetical protein
VVPTGSGGVVNLMMVGLETSQWRLKKAALQNKSLAVLGRCATKKGGVPVCGLREDRMTYRYTDGCEGGRRYRQGRIFINV